MSTIMLQRHTLADAFTQVGDPNTERALAAARQTIGEADWKAGYSRDRSKIVRDALREHDAVAPKELAGRLEAVGHTQTQSGGNTFDKLRVTLTAGTGATVILTGDMNSEFSQRLLAKLDTATQTGARQVHISGFAETVERGGRSFVNHVATLKTDQGEEIKAAPGHFSAAAERGQTAVSAMEKAGIKQPVVLNAAKDSARVEYFTELAQTIQARIAKDQKIETIEKTGQATGRFVKATEHGADRAHVEMQRAGMLVTVDVPRSALPETIEPGTPLKFRADKAKGVTVEVGRGSADKSRGI